MQKIIKRSIAVLLTAALLLSGRMPVKAKDTMPKSAEQVALTLHNPIYDSGVREVAPGTESAFGKLHNPTFDAATDTAVWDCVWFGNYWQSDTNGDGVANQNDAKEPIKWRVLSVDGDDVFLLADRNLDVKPYNTEYEDVTWETCTLRSWLNGYGSTDNAYGTDYTSDNFMDDAFSAAEQKTMKTTNVVNEGNPYYNTGGGNDTADKIYLLSIAETSNTAYGLFDGEFAKNSHTRESLNTAYVAEQEYMNAVGEADWWWLRSPGGRGRAEDVDCRGYGYYGGSDVDYADHAVRPALHLTLSASTPLSYAGTVKSTDTATWDCVWFGNYWQSDTNGDGTADKNDKKEPVKWRVLSVDGDDVFLLADKNLDVEPYNTEDEDVTWETCTLRSWLNGYGSADNACGEDYTGDNFIDMAFSAAEQSAVKRTNVINEDNPYYGTEGGNDTADKIYLLSIAEASSPGYGFSSGYHKCSDTRIALNTAYVAEQDMNTVGEADWWWLRSPGFNVGFYAAYVDNDGYGYGDGNGGSVDDDGDAVRPALHLTLSSSTPLSYAGTVCSDGTVTDAEGNIFTPTPTGSPNATPTPASAPTKAPTATPTNKPSAAPTSKPTAKPTADATKRPVSPTKSPAGDGTDTTPAPGQVVKDISSGAFYQIVSAGNVNATVSYLRPENKTGKAKVPAVIYHDGKKYKVTSVAKKAFAANKKLKTVVIGKNVKTIQKNAFKNCKNLWKITVKSKVLTKVGKNALKGTNKKLTVKVPKKKKAKYKKLFKGKGNKKLQVK